MGLITDFIVADDAELRRVFAGWYEVAPNPQTRTVTNPFTGKPQEVTEYERAAKVGAGDATSLPDMRGVSRLASKNVDHVKVAKLIGLLTGAEFLPALDEIRPALLPDTDDCGLERLPSSLSASLATLAQGDLAEAARDWAATEEMQLDGFTEQDCSDLLVALQQLVRSRRDGAGLYLCWCV